MNTDYNFIVSIVGALAWLPHFYNVIKRKIVKPKLSIFPDKNLTVGFTNDGPVMVFSIAILCENKSTLINEVKLILTHENNQKTEFLWEIIEEELMDLTIPGTGSMSNSRNHQAIALRIDEESLIERKYWFNSPKYSKEYNALLLKFREAYLNYINSKQDITNLKASSDYNNLIEFFKNEFIWKSGKYSVELIIKTSSGTTINNRFDTFLNRIEHKTLEENIPLFKDYIEQEYFDKNLTVKDWDWIFIRKS